MNYNILDGDYESLINDFFKNIKLDKDVNLYYCHTYFYNNIIINKISTNTQYMLDSILCIPEEFKQYYELIEYIDKITNQYIARSVEICYNKERKGFIMKMRIEDFSSFRNIEMFKVG